MNPALTINPVQMQQLEVVLAGRGLGSPNIRGSSARRRRFRYVVSLLVEWLFWAAILRIAGDRPLLEALFGGLAVAVIPGIVVGAALLLRQRSIGERVAVEVLTSVAWVYAMGFVLTLVLEAIPTANTERLLDGYLRPFVNAPVFWVGLALLVVASSGLLTWLAEGPRRGANPRVWGRILLTSVVGAAQVVAALVAGLALLNSDAQIVGLAIPASRLGAALLLVLLALPVTLALTFAATAILNNIGYWLSSFISILSFSPSIFGLTLLGAGLLIFNQDVWQVFYTLNAQGVQVVIALLYLAPLVLVMLSQIPVLRRLEEPARDFTSADKLRGWAERLRADGLTLDEAAVIGTLHSQPIRPGELPPGQQLVMLFKQLLKMVAFALSGPALLTALGFFLVDFLLGDALLRAWVLPVALPGAVIDPVTLDILRLKGIAAIAFLSASSTVLSILGDDARLETLAKTVFLEEWQYDCFLLTLKSRAASLTS